jgi:hypothetical protein
MVYPLWVVLFAACILAIPPIWFKGMTSVRTEPRYKFALVTCVVVWIAYTILVPSYLFEYSPLAEAPETWLNLTFFVTLILLAFVIIPTLLDLRIEMNQALTQKQIILLILVSFTLPIAVKLPVGDTFYSIRLESISWLFFTQSITTEYSFYYYFLSDFILSIQSAPTFPIGVMGWILNFAFIYQLTQYGRGRCRLRDVLILGLCTLLPTLLNNIFMKLMGYEPSSIVHLPIPILLFTGLFITRNLQPSLRSEVPEEEIEVAVPFLHRLRSRFWRKEK